MPFLRSVFVGLLIAVAPDARAGITITPPQGPQDPVVVSGLSDTAVDRLRSLRPAEWPARVAVYVVSADEVPPVMGVYAIHADRVLFTPRFPFEPGLSYRVQVVIEGHSAAITFVLPPAIVRRATTVTRIYPSADRLPENLLKFYIYFSAPMRGGDVYERIRLVESDGKEVEGAFVETSPELWDPDMRRVTVICHPGRIKRGLELHDRVGPPLVAGRSYRLVVGRMIDATGRPLAIDRTRFFEAAEADRAVPKVRAWTIDAPEAYSTLPLRVHLGEPFDHALLQRLVSVVHADGSPVAGSVTLGDHETVWAYYAEEPWQAGGYAVLVHPSLEDLAGNRPDRLFDSDATLPAVAAVVDVVRLEFHVR